MTGRVIQAAVLWAGIAALAASAAPEQPLRTPSVKAGPYQVAVDRISANRTNTLPFRTEPPRREDPGIQATRLIQLQIGLYSSDKTAAAGLTTFQVKGIAAEVAGRTTELAHYGGVLENPNDPALVRAYVYAPNFPLRTREIRWVEGEIVSYDRAATMDLNLPLSGARLPLVVEKDGVKATLREFSVNEGGAQLLLNLEAEPGSVLVNTVNDGTYGVSLVNGDNRPASPNGGTMLQPRPNQAEYRLSFGSVRSMPDHLQAHLLLRAGTRHVYPFRLEHLPLPDTLPAAETAAPKNPDKD